LVGIDGGRYFVQIYYLSSFLSMTRPSDQSIVLVMPYALTPHLYEGVNISNVFFIIVRVRQLSVRQQAVLVFSGLPNMKVFETSMSVFENGAEWTLQDVLYFEYTVGIVMIVLACRGPFSR